MEPGKKYNDGYIKACGFCLFVFSLFICLFVVVCVCPLCPPILCLFTHQSLTYSNFILHENFILSYIKISPMPYCGLALVNQAWTIPCDSAI